MLKNPLLVGLALLFAQTTSAQSAGDDHCEAPHFVVRDSTGAPITGIDLPLISTSAEVSIAGTIANVTVHQVYRNTTISHYRPSMCFPPVRVRRCMA